MYGILSPNQVRKLEKRQEAVTVREKGHLEGASREHFGAREAEAFKDRLALLRRVSPAERLATLAALLDGSSEAERPALVVELIELAAPFGSEGGPCVASSVMRRFGERRRKTSDSALALLARRWEEIPDELKGAARSVGAGRWGGLAAQLASDTESGVRRSLAKLCSDCADADLAGTVVGLLADPDPGTGAAAEQALLALAFSLSGIDARTGERRGDEPVHQRRDPLIEEAIGRAVMSVSEHRRRGPFVAAMALLAPWRLRRKYDDSGERLASWFRDPPAESRGALRAAIRLSSHPLARGRALEWLAIATLSDACAERLARARTPDEHEAVLQRSHLLANPVRARAMKGIDIKAVRSKTVAASAGRREAALPDAVMLASLSVTARRGLARYVGSLDTSVENRRAALEPLLSDPDALARLASLGHSTGAGVLDLCFDADARVARSALMSWSLIGERGAGAGFEARLNLSSEPARRRTLSRLARSSHGAVRRMAVQESKFIECLDPASPASRVCARWLMLRDPGLLENRVREAMGSPDQARRVRAVQLVRYLGWCARFEPELLAIVESTPEEGRAAATAVAALGELQTPSSIAVVQSRLADADLRVRANAVEALARQSRGHGDLASDCPSAYGMLIELKDDADHRVRANALRALLGRPSVAIEGKPGLRAQRLYEPAAVESLAEMLVDPRASHRLAAAWLAGRVLPLEGRARLGKRFAELATRVGEAAAGDEDTDVRRRARQCVETLRSELRTAWAGRARKREKPVSGAAA